jgi:hypothetical protein
MYIRERVENTRRSVDGGEGARVRAATSDSNNVPAVGRDCRPDGGPRSASSVSVPPEREKTRELMRSRERRNRRSASIWGECSQVTEYGVTEPGLQADSLEYRQ